MTARRTIASAVAAIALLSAPPGRAADFQTNCAQWIEKPGYSAHHIKLSIGKRQHGMPNGWRGNVAPRDVVVAAIRDKPPHLRFSFVEEVRPNTDRSAGAAVVTEWNEGSYVDERSFATRPFDRDSGWRSIPIATVVQARRPSLPMPGAATDRPRAASGSSTSIAP